MDGMTTTREILLAVSGARAGACGYVLKENLIAIREFLGKL
jgi:hypothetical protein